MSVPFAVRETPEVRPDLWPLARTLPDHVEDDGPPTLVRYDADVPPLVAAARAAVAEDPRPWTSHVPGLDPPHLLAAGLALGRAVADAAPQLLAVEGRTLSIPDVGVSIDAEGRVGRTRPTGPGAGRGDAAAIAERLDAVPPSHRPLELVALAVAEDVVVVDRGGRAIWLHVCAPSGWDPGTAAGRHLAELHGPVPAADRLRTASAALAAAIVGSGPHVRWVWGLTDDPAAAHHPRFRGPPSTERGDVGDLTFRAERQTTLPLAALGLGVFLIRVHRAPLREVVDRRERRERLAAAIRSLPPELARYKGVAERRSDVLAWLGHAPSPSM